MVGLVLVLFLSCGLVGSDPVETHLICSQQPITALVGDDVILPCHLEPPVSAADWTVEWSKPGLDPESVHYYENGRPQFDKQNPSYSFRTELFVDDMKTGNVSVKIFDVVKSDSGIYKCFLPSIKKEASIELVVVERRLIGSQQPITALFGDDVILPCHLKPPVSAADWTVEWSKPGLVPESVHYHEEGGLRVKEQNPSFSDRTSLSVDEMKTGDVSLRIFNVKKNDSGIYKCFLPSIKKEASIELIVGEPVMIGSTKPVQARVFVDVILQCHLEPPLDVTNMLVEWRHENEIVHVYRDGQDDPELQDERFRGRTSLFRQEMTKGKISLKLSRVTPEDSGEFTCFIPTLKKGHVSLFVGFTSIIVCNVAAFIALAFTAAVISLYCLEKRARARAEAEARARLMDKVKNAKVRFENAKVRFENAKVRFENANVRLTNVKVRFTNVKVRFTNAENRANKVEAEARAREEALVRAKKALDEVTDATKKATDLESRVTDLRERATYLKNQATDAENRATDLENIAADLENGATDTADRARDLGNRATDLENRATDLENGATDLENGATDLENGATDLENGATDLENGATDLENGLTELETSAKA